MTKSKLLERTALSGFTLGGIDVLPGRVVKLDSDQFERAANAGCIERDEEKNSLIPVIGDEPVLRASSAPAGDVLQAQFAEAQAAATAELAALDAEVNKVRVAAAAEIEKINAALEDHRQQAETDKAAITLEVENARKQADDDLAKFKGEIADAEKAVTEAKNAADAAKNKGGK